MNQNELQHKIEDHRADLNELTARIPDLPCSGEVQEELVKAYHHLDMAERKLKIEKRQRKAAEKRRRK